MNAAQPKLVLRRAAFRDPALTALLAIQCFIVFIGAPLAASGVTASHLLFEFLVISLAFVVFVLSPGRVATTISIVAIVAGVTGSSLELWTPSTATSLLAHTGTAVALVLVVYVLSKAVFAPGEVTAHRVLGAIALYLNFGLLFTTAYRLIWDLVPGSISGIDAGLASWSAYGSLLYFSFVTLTSVGYGDIVPVHSLARSLANLEAIIGQLFPATLLARLITLELGRHRDHDRRDKLWEARGD